MASKPNFPAELHFASGTENLVQTVLQNWEGKESKRGPGAEQSQPIGALASKWLRKGVLRIRLDFMRGKPQRSNSPPRLLDRIYRKLLNFWASGEASYFIRFIRRGRQ